MQQRAADFLPFCQNGRRGFTGDRFAVRADVQTGAGTIQVDACGLRIPLRLLPVLVETTFELAVLQTLPRCVFQTFPFGVVQVGVLRVILNQPVVLLIQLVQFPLDRDLGFLNIRVELESSSRNILAVAVLPQTRIPLAPQVRHDRFTIPADAFGAVHDDFSDMMLVGPVLDLLSQRIVSGLAMPVGKPAEISQATVGDVVRQNLCHRFLEVNLQTDVAVLGLGGRRMGQFVHQHLPVPRVVIRYGMTERRGQDD